MLTARGPTPLFTLGRRLLLDRFFLVGIVQFISLDGLDCVLLRAVFGHVSSLFANEAGPLRAQLCLTLVTILWLPFLFLVICICGSIL